MAKYKNFAELKISDFRAIKSADINLNGITVVSGINSCGKSTIGKLLHNIYDITIYPEIKEYIDSNIPDSYKRMLQYICSEFGVTPLVIKNDIDVFIKNAQNEEYKDKLYSKEFLQLMQLTVYNKSGNINVLLNKFQNDYSELFNQYLKIAQKRQSSYFKWIADKIYPQEDAWSHIQFSDNGQLIIDKDLGSYPEPTSINHYYLLGSSVQPSENEYLDHALKCGLETEGKSQESIQRINESIIRIINGTVSFDLENDKFIYATHNKIIDLNEAGYGVKLFGYLQMLLNNGWLESKTLLIIDEPEAHLHPQWIVEYARLVVMLHKELGVKFFVASHNPQMVSSIKYIAEKEGVLEAVNFYHAEKENEDDLQYTFKDCGQDIEPIFESFNNSPNSISPVPGRHYHY